MKATRNARRSRPQSGATLMEFALSFLLTLMLMAAVVEGAVMLWTYSTLAHATREAGRYAMVHGARNPVDDSAVQNRVATSALGLDDRLLTVSIDWTDPEKSGGSVVEIRSVYPVRFLASSLIFGQGEINLSATTRTVLAE